MTLLHEERLLHGVGSCKTEQLQDLICFVAEAAGGRVQITLTNHYTSIHGVHEHGARRPRPRAVDGRASTLADLLR